MREWTGNVWKLVKGDTSEPFAGVKTAGLAPSTAIQAAWDSGSIRVGSIVRTSGYYEDSDDGGATYRVVPPATGTEDGGRFITFDGFQLRAVFSNGSVDVAQFGARGVNDSAAVQAAIDYAPHGSTVTFSVDCAMDRQVSWQSKTLHLVATRAVTITRGFTTAGSTIDARYADRSTVSGPFLFVGGSTAAAFASLYASGSRSGFYNYSAIRFRDSPGVRVEGPEVISHFSGVCLIECSRANVARLTVTGFGAAILVLGQPANYHVGVVALGGANVVVDKLTTFDVGNSVNAGGSPTSVSGVVSGLVATGNADNCIYLTGHAWTIVDPNIDGVNSSGVRLDCDDAVIRGGVIASCGAGVGIRGRPSGAGVYQSKWSGRGCKVLGTRIVDCPKGIEFGAGDTAYTYGHLIDGVTFEGITGAGAIYGTADYVTIRNIVVRDNAGSSSSIRLFGAGTSATLVGILVDGATLFDGGTTPILLTDVADSRFANITSTGRANPSGNWLSATNVDNTDFISLTSDTGKAFESSTCALNLWANIRGPVASQLSGASHRQWTVAA